MPTPQERISNAIRFFFERALPQATGRTFAQLSAPQIHVGAYVPHSGPPVATSLGHSVTPRFMLRVSPALPASGGMPAAGAIAIPTSGATRHIVWLRHVADPVVDTEAEIARVMADIDSFAAVFAAPQSAPTGEGAGAAAAAPTADGAAAGTAATAAVAEASLRASDWARAIKAAQASLPANLTALTEVPAPLRTVAADVEALKQVLLHFFTYRAEGTRYSRWSGAGRDASNPAHLTPEYKQENVREFPLEREHVYLYAVVPEGLLSRSGDLDRTAFREVIIRFDETGEAESPYTLATVHTARWRRNAAPHEDFVFLYTELGEGIAFARELREKMSARLLEFLGQVESAGTAIAEVLRAATHVLTESTEKFLRLLVVMDAQAPLPAFAVGDDEGSVRSVQIPLDKLGEFAALPNVQHIDVVPPVTKYLDLARTAVRYPDLLTKIAAAKRGGKGVVVGIIDTGIDGSHPAFAGRIHAFWDQASTPTVSGQSPKRNNPSTAAYRDMDFGIEVTKTTTPQTTANARDPDGHGTHVAGIAAGAEVRDSAGNVTVPAGLAPQATIVAVRAIGVDQSDFVVASRYVFQKASELGMPCVINMSFGQHFHAHDGSDLSSRALFKAMTDANRRYRPGRIVAAAAGNERRNQSHVRRRVPANSGMFQVATVRIGQALGSDILQIWIKNPLSACPVRFPLDLFLFRVTTPASTNVTRLVRLGTSATAANPAGVFAALRTRIEVESSLSDAVNGDFNYQVVFSSTSNTLAMAPVQWRVVMINASRHPLDVHMWLPFEPDAPATPSVFTDFTPADRSYMVGAPAASAAAISVASSNTRLSWTTPTGPGGPIAGTLNDISVFSSPGPLRESSIPPTRFYGVTHEINAIDTTAPGAMLQAAKSAQATFPPHLMINNQSVVLSGTSMASPVVTGLVANILAEEPNLTLADVLTRLKNASAIPASSAFQPPAGTPGPRPLSQDWGYGLINAGLLKP